MANEEYTFAGYLGVDFQLKLLWQLVTEPEFAEKILPSLEIEYFDNAIYKRFFVVLSSYHKTYNKVANLQNKSVDLAIKKFSKASDPTELEILTSVAEQLKNWNDRVLNKEVQYNGDIIQTEAFTFIKQQEYRKLADFIQISIKKGEKSEDILTPIEERIKKIIEIGADDDMGIEVMDDPKRALRPEFRRPISTGINVIDDVTNGGLGNGEMGVILAPLGVGKTTILTKIANSACSAGFNVLQIIFEDTEDQVRRKHYAIWSKTPLSEIDKDSELVERKLLEWHQVNKPGKLIIKKFSQDNTTMPKIRQYIDRFQKKFGIKFDMVVLDYIDCVESHKSGEDQNARELYVIKAFESMAGELDIPCWTAIQANRGGLSSEFVSTDQMGGNIKKAQKTHFLMSVAKTPDQKMDGTANVAILKARMVQDGFIYKDIIFNNDTLEIRRLDPFQPKSIRNNLEKVKINDDDVKNFNDKLNKLNNVEQPKVERDNELDYHNDVRVASEESVREYEYADANSSISNENGSTMAKEVLNTLNGSGSLDDDKMDFINQQLSQIAKNQQVRKK